MAQDARERVLAVTAANPRVVDVGGVATSILEAGDGPPLLLLHAGVESGAAVWAPVLDRLAESYWVVAPDIPGALRPSWYAAFDEYNRAQARVKQVKKTMNRRVSLRTKRIREEERSRIHAPHLENPEAFLEVLFAIMPNGR